MSDSKINNTGGVTVLSSKDVAKLGTLQKSSDLSGGESFESPRKLEKDKESQAEASKPILASVPGMHDLLEQLKKVEQDSREGPSDEECLAESVVKVHVFEGGDGLNS